MIHQSKPLLPPSLFLGHEIIKNYFRKQKRRLAKLREIHKSGGLKLCWQKICKKFGKHKLRINGSLEKEWYSLTFPQFKEVTISIIVPMHNHCIYSFTCLNSILENTKDLRYEIIAIDDGSQDDTSLMLSQCKNIKIITNKTAKGFVLACNQGIQQAQGKYILLLNNDTKVINEWFRPLLKPFINNQSIAIVGAKLIYPNGLLQEAGGIIWKDASGCNFGRNDDPDKPGYSYLREVDYCSGAAILIKRDILEKLGGLDLRYVPAYYEDTDLAFAVRNLGFKVIFQPLSRIIHYEGVSSGRSVDTGIKRFQVINRKKFQKKWKGALSEQFDSDENIYLARERGKKKRILIVDHFVPEYDKDSGSMRLFWIIKIINKLGHKIIFWPDDLYRREPYTSELQQMGVEVIYGRDSLKKYLAQNGKYIDLAWVCRRHVACKHHKITKSLINAPIFFDTVDLQYLRKMRQAKISNQRLSRIVLIGAAQAYKKMELDLARNSDVTLVVSPVEKNLLEEEGISNVEILSNIHVASESTNSLDGRKELMFIGSFTHPPNVDAVTWFVDSMWLSIKRVLPDIKFFIVGSNPPPSIRVLARRDIIVTGYQKDVRLYFQQSRVFICPLRYGAGVKGKIGHSLSMGLPVVTTSVGAEGMGLDHEENALIADDEESFMKNIVRLYTSDTLWTKLSRNGLRHIEDHFSPEIAREKIQTLLNKYCN